MKKNNLIMLLIFVFAVLTLLFTITFNSRNKFQVLELEYSNYPANLPITVQFSESIVKNSIDNFNINLDGTYVVRDDKIIYSVTEDVNSDQTFTITFDSIESVSGSEIKNFSRQGTFGKVPINELNEEDIDILVSQSDSFESSGILSDLPRQVDEYSIQFKYEEDKLVLDVFIYQEYRGTQTYEYYSSEVLRKRRLAKEWIELNNSKDLEYTIDFEPKLLDEE